MLLSLRAYCVATLEYGIFFSTILIVLLGSCINNITLSTTGVKTYEEYATLQIRFTLDYEVF